MLAPPAVASGFTSTSFLTRTNVTRNPSVFASVFAAKAVRGVFQVVAQAVDLCGYAEDKSAAARDVPCRWSRALVCSWS